ncbi:hypothetical protein WN48_10768 [Eufriesea mexicana]|uniref:Uncharacterized protein n=1 Tax=Eufriesea mexicana TaxID=516756 RepID=A0A310S8W2_9HYME|nr:hypothetical protein WN48_10768 [Eufriesea mexicana]
MVDSTAKVSRCTWLMMGALPSLSITSRVQLTSIFYKSQSVWCWSSYPTSYLSWTAPIPWSASGHYWPVNGPYLLVTAQLLQWTVSILDSALGNNFSSLMDFRRHCIKFSNYPERNSCTSRPVDNIKEQGHQETNPAIKETARGPSEVFIGVYPLSKIPQNSSLKHLHGYTAESILARSLGFIDETVGEKWRNWKEANQESVRGGKARRLNPHKFSDSNEL